MTAKLSAAQRNDNYTAAVAETLRAERAAAGLTIPELADRAGMVAVTLQRVLKARARHHRGAAGSAGAGARYDAVHAAGRGGAPERWDGSQRREQHHRSESGTAWWAQTIRVPHDADQRLEEPLSCQSPATA